jgi:hypothetical protein
MLFSLPAGTEMFHFPAFPPRTLYIQMRVTGHASSRVSPFGHPRITARLPAPRGLSQAPTSFIGSWCQGIHRMPLQTCHTTNQLDTTHPPTHHTEHAHHTNHATPGRYMPQKLTDARVHYTVLKQRTDTNQYPGTHPHPRKRYDRPAGPPETTPTPHHSRGRLFPQDPTVCHEPPQPPAAPSHHKPPTGDPGVLARRTSRNSPMSTFHP